MPSDRAGKMLPKQRNTRTKQESQQEVLPAGCDRSKDLTSYEELSSTSAAAGSQLTNFIKPFANDVSLNGQNVDSCSHKKPLTASKINPVSNRKTNSPHKPAQLVSASGGKQPVKVDVGKGDRKDEVEKLINDNQKIATKKDGLGDQGVKVEGSNWIIREMRVTNDVLDEQKKEVRKGIFNIEKEKAKGHSLDHQKTQAKNDVMDNLTLELNKSILGVEKLSVHEILKDNIFYTGPVEVKKGISSFEGMKDKQKLNNQREIINIESDIMDTDVKIETRNVFKTRPFENRINENEKNIQLDNITGLRRSKRTCKSTLDSDDFLNNAAEADEAGTASLKMDRQGSGSKRIGSAYQAELPVYQEYDPNESDRDEMEERETCVWKPDDDGKINLKKLDEFYQCARRQFGLGIDHVLEAVFKNGYDLCKAMAQIEEFIPDSYQAFTSKEVKLFRKHVNKQEKNFGEAKLKLKRPISELVDFYYSTKFAECLGVVHSDQPCPELMRLHDEEAPVIGREKCDNCNLRERKNRLCFICELYYRRYRQYRPFTVSIEDTKPKAGVKLVRDNGNDAVGRCEGIKTQSNECEKEHSCSYSDPKNSMLRWNRYWSDEEKAAAVRGFRMFGKDYAAIAATIPNKNAALVQEFYIHYRYEYRIDHAIKLHNDDIAARKAEEQSKDPRKGRKRGRLMEAFRNNAKVAHNDVEKSDHLEGSSELNDEYA